MERRSPPSCFYDMPPMQDDNILASQNWQCTQLPYIDPQRRKNTRIHGVKYNKNSDSKDSAKSDIVQTIFHLEVNIQTFRSSLL